MVLQARLVLAVDNRLGSDQTGHVVFDDLWTLVLVLDGTGMQLLLLLRQWDLRTCILGIRRSVAVTSQVAVDAKRGLVFHVHLVDLVFGVKLA